MKKLTQIMMWSALALPFAVCNMSQAADSLFGEVSKADLVMQGLKREIRDAGDKYEVIVRFTPGRDANDRTIVHYFFHVRNEYGERELRITQKHSEICSGDVCQIALYSISSRKEGAEASILAGLQSTIMVRFMKSPGTVQSNGVRCESEKSSGCPCYPCSTGPDVTAPNIKIPKHVKEILEIQNREHLHAGWIVPVK